jgi:hypothetical protein
MEGYKFEFVNKTIDEHGFYTVEMRHLGQKVKFSSFFPAEWSREKVINKIYEAYDNFMKNGANARQLPNGRYLAQGLTSEGIKIDMHITKEAVMKTAYPVLK